MVSAHAPLGVGSNEGISNATLINTPEKSFVIYTELHESGEAQYYHFPMKKGERLYGSLQIPGPGSMVPNLAIIGPGIESTGNVPSFVEIPAMSGAMLVEGKSPGKPAYEPFSPQPIYEVADFNITIPEDGNYYIAVYGPDGGKYSLAPGFLEEFTLSEWLLIPYSVLTIHLWEGQSPGEIVAPMVIVMISGLILVFYHQKKPGLRLDPIGWMIIVSGLLYVGGAAMTAMQIVHTVQVTGYTPEIVLTLIFIAGPVILGILAIMTGIRSPETSSYRRTGIKMVLIGLLGLVVWAGLIAGPVLALISGVLMLMNHAGKPVPA